MKKLIINIIFTLTSLLAATSVNAQDLIIKWGLQNANYFKEVKATADQNAAYNPPARKKDKLYRYFTTNTRYKNQILSVFDRHNKLLAEYEKSYPNSDKLTKKDFFTYAEHSDPFLLGRIKDMAPVLYFDFIGKNFEYVLESITVRTIGFEEYKGGGFLLNEGWYDIELKHAIGTFTYPIDRKLKFNGSGRAMLRFWSDNYYPSMKMSPMGCYMIDITFNFMANGHRTSVSTGPFKIDV